MTDRSTRIWWVFPVLFPALWLGCTSSTPVGRICDLGSDTPGTSEVVVASPSLDCVSRTCFRVPLQRELPPGSSFPAGNTGLCTAECETDSDCDRVPESPCVTGFTCGIPVSNGPFCCRKFCVCKDYVVVPPGEELQLGDSKENCDPSVAENACCNLPGRTNNPSYPLCKG